MKISAQNPVSASDKVTICQILRSFSAREHSVTQAMMPGIIPHRCARKPNESMPAATNIITLGELPAGGSSAVFPHFPSVKIKAPEQTIIMLTINGNAPGPIFFMTPKLWVVASQMPTKPMLTTHSAASESRITACCELLNDFSLVFFPSSLVECYIGLGQV